MDNELADIFWYNPETGNAWRYDGTHDGDYEFRKLVDAKWKAMALDYADELRRLRDSIDRLLGE